MAKIKFDIDIILKHNKDGSFGTQSARRETLRGFAKDISKTNKKLILQNLKPKHIVEAVDLWKFKGLTDATIKNKVSHLRWLSEKINKQNIIPRTNKELGIKNRKYSDNTTNKAKDIDYSKITKLTKQQRLSIQLQRSFGLRCEESLKIKVSQADKGDKLVLQPSWCKGGRPREIPIRTIEQRSLLNECKLLVKNESMMNKDTSYVKARGALYKACERAEIKNMHGFRHAYAQERYLELMCAQCPKNNGLVYKEMTAEQKAIDSAARLQISQELGHNRERVTFNYLGR